jgi:4-amino-4-deoxy-L-arabinose transferase-like glycosyltransferase
LRRISPQRLPLALLLVLGLGALLRILLGQAYSPTVVNLADVTSYSSLAEGELFSSNQHSAGYPLFLRALHAVSSDITFTITVQHVLGLLTAVVLYATVRRLGAPAWAGVAAAAAIALSLDQVFLEHAIMTETLVTLLLTLGVYAAIRALDARTRVRGPVTTRVLWLLLAGATLGVAAYVRPFVAVLVPVLALWTALALPGSLRRRCIRAGVPLLAGAVVIVVYWGTNAAETGYFGFLRGSGWAAYARTAQFADCSRFDPPAGASRLCERRPSSVRPGPDFYAWHPDSPARKLFGGPPAGSDELAAFGRAAIMHQPLDYLETVLNDTLRYFAPGYNDDRPFAGPGYDVMDVDRRALNHETAINRALDRYYQEERFQIRGGVHALADAQQFLRVHPLLLLQGLVLGIAGLVLAPARLRWGLVLLLGVAAVLLVVPPATVLYGARYAVPPSGFLIAAGAIGLWAIWRRALDRRNLQSGPSPSDPPPAATSQRSAQTQPVAGMTP